MLEKRISKNLPSVFTAAIRDLENEFIIRTTKPNTK